MRVFIFAGLLACIHGLGDRAQYTNNQNNVWTAVGQAAGSWQLNTCVAGTAQSPINIVTATATAPAPALPPLVATGHDQDVPVRLDIDGNPGQVAGWTGLRMTPQAPTQAVLSGGPLMGSYAFSHAEFHWGNAAGILGAEHSIDGARAAMEMQLVYHRTQFTAAQAAQVAAATGPVACQGTAAAPIAQVPTNTANNCPTVCAAAACSAPASQTAVVAAATAVAAANAVVAPELLNVAQVTVAAAAAAVAAAAPLTAGGTSAAAQVTAHLALFNAAAVSDGTTLGTPAAIAAGTRATAIAAATAAGVAAIPAAIGTGIAPGLFAGSTIPENIVAVASAAALDAATRAYDNSVSADIIVLAAIVGATHGTTGNDGGATTAAGTADGILAANAAALLLPANNPPLPVPTPAAFARAAAAAAWAATNFGAAVVTVTNNINQAINNDKSATAPVAPAAVAPAKAAGTLVAPAFTSTAVGVAAAAAATAAVAAPALTAYDQAVIASTTPGAIDNAGVAVISYQIDVGATNTELAVLAAALPTVAPAPAVAGSFVITAGAALVDMSALMMLNQGALNDYFTYDGSLTAPASFVHNNARTSCAEIVRWIIPTQRLTATAAEMAAFNANMNFGWAAGTISNSRALTGQALAVRRVQPAAAVRSNSVWNNLAGTLLSVGTFGLVHNLLNQEETAKALTENPVVDLLQDIEQRFAGPAAPQERQSFNHHYHPKDIQY